MKICFAFRFALVPVYAIALMALAMGASAPAHAIEIQKVTSEKGITAWLVEEHAIPLVAMRFSFKGGASGDPEDKQGLAHFLTAMMNEGAGDLDSEAYQAREQELAMRMSFSTDQDEFTGTLQTLSRNRDASLDMLKLALTAARFDEVPLERIRNQLLIGRKQALQDPEQIASSAWMKTIFGSHPYSRRSKGTIDGVKAVSSTDLHELTKRLFARDGLLIAVVGDIDAATLKLRLDTVFGGLPEKSGMPDLPEAKVAAGPAVSVIDRDIPQSIIRFGHRGIKRDDPDFIPAFVMNHILGGGGFGSRLVDEVREKRGLSYSVYSALYPLERAGLFMGGAATVNERASETIEVVRAELRRMADDGPTKDELKDAKTFLTGSYALRFDSNRKIAGQLLGIQRAKLGIDYVNTRNAMVEAVSLDDVKRVAKRIIDADHLIFTVVGRPKKVTSSGDSG